MSDNIIVQWQDNGGWREGVLCAANVNGYAFVATDVMRRIIVENHGVRTSLVIWDRHRNERVVVPLSGVHIVEPRCEICEGTGELMVTRNRINHDTLEPIVERSSEPCPVCQGTGKVYAEATA